LKRFKLHQFFNGVERTFSYTQAWVSEGGQEFEKISAKKVVFLVSSSKKTNFTTFDSFRKTFGTNQ